MAGAQATAGRQQGLAGLFDAQRQLARLQAAGQRQQQLHAGAVDLFDRLAVDDGVFVFGDGGFQPASSTGKGVSSGALASADLAKLAWLNIAISLVLGLAAVALGQAITS